MYGYRYIVNIGYDRLLLILRDAVVYKSQEIYFLELCFY